MKCFGDKNKVFHCKVILLDEQELIQEVQETTIGQELLDVVFKHLNLLESSYFGLRYVDPSNQTHWLDGNKRLAKQLKGSSPHTLYFSVKFYAADPTKLIEEITRYQFFLQVKQDILQGRLPVTSELTAELGALAVQSELGDYDPRRHSPGYVSEFRFTTNQSIALESRIAELHKKLVGYVPSKAELCYLEKVKWMDMYGVDLHPVLGEDSTEYFLGLTPSGIIVLRNKSKVGNYFWPRITKINFKGKFFMLRVKDKNNIENTYGFETPSKGACRHLWQCCVEHHAFFRLTQAASNAPHAMFKLGSKFRYSGRTEKEIVNDMKSNGRPQTEFTRTPSRRYQRRVVEATQDSPKSEESESKPETRTVVSLPGSVTTGSHVYRSTSMTLGPRNDSPRSTRSAPHNAGLQRQSQFIHGSSARKDLARVHLTAEPTYGNKTPSRGRSPDVIDRLTRRTSSLESRSSADSRSCSRSCSRHRRSRCRSSDGESEASSKCSNSSKSQRKHHKHHRRHRNHSNDSSSDHHKHRHRRHRHRSNEKSEPQMVQSNVQWTNIQNGITPSRSNTATVRDLTNGYIPSGYEDTELDTSRNSQSSRRKHRKNRSADGKSRGYPEELRKHIDFDLQSPDGMTESELRDIPYTKVEVPRQLKTRYSSPHVTRSKSPKRSKSNSSDRKSHRREAASHSMMNGTRDEAETVQLKNSKNKAHFTPQEYPNDPPKSRTPNGILRPCPRSSQDLSSLDRRMETVPQDLSQISPRSNHLEEGHLRTSQEPGTLQRHQMKASQSSIPPSVGPKPIPNGVANGAYRETNGIATPSYFAKPAQFSSSFPENTRSPSLHQNPRSADVFRQRLPDSRYCREASIHSKEEADSANGSGDSNDGGFMSQCPTLLKNATTEQNSHFTAVLKPQPSPQSSVTSGISVGSSSVSISTDSSLRRNAKSFHLQSSLNNDLPASLHSRDVTPSTTPDSETLAYYDSRLPEEKSFNQSLSLTEPLYINSFNNHKFVTNNINSLNNELTQHSTNILIRYHDTNSTGSSPRNIAPTPTPRSSIISTYHCNDTSTQIVQSYGPAYANSHIINSIKSNKNSSMNPSNKYTSFMEPNPSDIMNHSSSKELDYHVSDKYFSLPRSSVTGPKTKSSSSQTKPDFLNDKLHHDRHLNDEDNRSSSERPNKNFLKTTTIRDQESIPKANKFITHNTDASQELLIGVGNKRNSVMNEDTSIMHSSTSAHWKVCNWDTSRNKDAWCNAGAQENHQQELPSHQRSESDQFNRRGSAGSLDLILGPLIQSALEHQQR